MNKHFKNFSPRGLFLISCLILGSCKVGPDYHPATLVIPTQYRESTPPPQGWKLAKPQDEIPPGCWWEVFGNPELNAMEMQVNISNQNIALAIAQYEQSMALLEEARAAVFPVVNGFVSYTREKPPASTFSNSSGTGSAIPTQNKPRSLPPFSTYIVNFTATWVPDLWGGVRRSLEASGDTAEASAAQIAAIRLSTQAALAQDYFQLRTLDSLQQLLDEIVAADRKLLKLTQGRYRAGTASLADIAQVQAILQAAEAAAINNGVSRALTEHAIAALLGTPPSLLAIKPQIIPMHPPLAPPSLPSELLERRPDVAQAERSVAAANAEIGVAIATFYPTLPLTASGGFQSNKFPLLFTGPSAFWLLTAELMDTIIDGGLRSAQVAAAKAVYDQTVATYRQTVITAFQNVEDGLAAQRILLSVAEVQKQAVQTAKLSLRLELADYKAGTVDLTSVLTAQTNAYSIEENYINVVGQQMNTAVSLITALGGGWDVTPLLQGAPQ